MAGIARVGVSYHSRHSVCGFPYMAGLQDVDMNALSPSEPTRRGVPIGLREIPERAFDSSSISQITWLDSTDVRGGGSQGGGERPYTSRRGADQLIQKGSDQSSQMQELEAKVYLLEGLLPRVARLEALEVAKRRRRQSRSRDIELPSSADDPPSTKPPQRGALGVRFEDTQEVDAVRIKIA